MTLVSCQVKKAKKPLEESSVKKNKLPRRIAIGIALGVLVGSIALVTIAPALPKEVAVPGARQSMTLISRPAF